MRPRTIVGVCFLLVAAILGGYGLVSPQRDYLAHYLFVACLCVGGALVLGGRR